MSADRSYPGQAAAEVLQVIAAASRDLKQSLSAIAEKAARHCRAYDAVLTLRQSESLVIAGHHGPIPVSIKSGPLSRAWTAGRAVIDGIAVHVHDLSAAGDEYPVGAHMAREMGHRTTLSVPLVRHGRPLGAFTLRRLEVDPFTDEQISLLVEFADHAAIAVENAQLFENAEARNRELAATSEVLRVIARSPSNMQPALDAIAHSASSVCEAYDSMIFLRDGDVLRLQAHDGPIPTLGIGSEMPVNRSSATGVALIEGRPVHVPDILAAAAQFPEGSEIARRLGHRTTLAVPLLRDGEGIGVILVRRLEVAAFSQRQIDLLSTFADQAVIAIENVRLFEEVQTRNQEVTEALAQQTATAEVLKTISSSAFDLDAVLRTLVKSAAELCRAYGGIISLRDGDVYRVAQQFGTTQEEYEFLRSRAMPIERGTVTGRVALTGGLVQIADVLEDPEYTDLEAQRLSQDRTLLGVPLLRNGEVLGVFVLARVVVQLFSPREIDLVKTFADQAVIAIENVRLFEEVQTRNRELGEALQQQTATAEVLKAISRSAFDLQAVLDRLVESAARLVGTGRAAIFLRDADTLHPAASFGASDELQAADHSMPIDRRTISGRVVLSGEPQFIADVRADLEYGYEPIKQSDEVRSMMGVPLARHGQVLGVFIVERPELGPFTKRQIDLLTTFADQAVIAIENVRLFEEVQSRNREVTEALQQQTATAEVLQVISRSAFDLQTVLDTLVASAARLCGADGALICRRQGDIYPVAATYGISAEFMDYMALHPVLPDRGSATGRAILDGRPVQVQDVLADPNYGRLDAQSIGGWRAILAVPLLREGSPIGTIALFHTTPRPFTPRQVELVATFADQAVIAIENVRLFEEVQARNRELSATSEVLRVIAASPTDVQPVLDVVAESAAKLCEAFDASILLQDGESLVWKSHFGPIPIGLERWPISRDWVTGRAFVDRKTFHIHDLLSERDEYPVGQSMAGRMGFRTFLAVPLLRGGEAIGVIGVRRAEIRPFTQKQIDLLTTFADQAVIAMENARLFEEVQARTKALQTSLEYQTATSDVLSVISRSPTELQPVLDAIVETAARLCGADMATIRRRVGNTNNYATVATHGFTPEQAEYSRSRPFVAGPGSVAGRVAVTLQTVHVPDIDAEPGYAHLEMARRTGWRSILSVPLLREGDLVGILSLFHVEPGPFSSEAIERAETFADQAVIAIENTRLFEEVQARTRELSESLDHQTATSELLEVIGRSTIDLQPVFDTLAESAVRLCEAERAFVFRFDGEVLRAAAWYGTSPELAAMIAAHPVRLGRQTIAARAGSERKTVHVLDVQSDPEYTYFTKDIDPIRTVLAVPMLRGDELHGVTVIYRPEVRPFSSSQVALMETFSDQAVIAIENARLFEEVQARTAELQSSLEYQTATSNVLSIISRSPTELQPVLDAIAETAARLCGADKATIRRRVGDSNAFATVAAHGFTPEQAAHSRLQPLIAGPGSVAGQVAATRKTVHVPDIHADPSYTQFDFAQKAGYRSVLSVPLLRDEELIGILTLLHTEDRPFSAEAIERAETFADQAVIAIENARLFEALQSRTSELSRTVGELEALGEVGQTISSTLDVQAVLTAILTHACQLASSGSGAIYTFNKAIGVFELESGHNMSDELITEVRARPVALNDALIGECAARRTAIQIEDLSLVPPHPVYTLHLKAGVRALLALPLVHRDEVVGALVVRRQQTGAFGPATVNLLQAFATQSAIAIHNARLFREMEDKSHQLSVASRHKSQFLANMSHELRTPLNSVLGFAEMLADGLYGELPEKAKVTLGRIQANGKHLLGLINDVLDLSKIEAGQLVLAMEDYSIGQIVKSVVATTEPLARAKGLKLSATVADGLPFGRGDERRISQVLLNLTGNAVKFTERGSIDITAIVRGGGFEILVRDTGPGIAPEHQQRIFEEFQQIDGSSTRQKGGTGLGLAISKRIVELHGGRIELDSLVGAGSTFRVRLPIQAEKGASGA